MIRDSIAGFDLSDALLHEHGNEFNALETLLDGLNHLYRQVETIESDIKSKLDPKRVSFSLGNDPRLAGVPLRLVACYFHWYATTAVNFVQLVGWLRKQGEKTESTPTPKSYVKEVLPAVFLWRHKVSAHFARHSQRGDSPADQMISVMAPLAFNNDAFYAGAMALKIRVAGQSSESHLKPWSLTKVHRELQKRYEPAGV